MGKKNELLSEEGFSYMKFDERSKEDLLKRMAAVLIQKGLVYPDYTEAVMAREKIFPTGLPTKGISIAIPHTDAKHVKRPFMLVGVLDQEIEFEVMAGEGEKIGVNLVFMLAIKEAAQQVEMLQKLILMCQKEENLIQLKEGHNVKKILGKIVSEEGKKC